MPNEIVSGGGKKKPWWAGWRGKSPNKTQRRKMMKRCGKKCFLGPNLSFPICAKGTCRKNKRGIMSAYIRAKQWGKHKSFYKNYWGKPRMKRKVYTRAAKKARKLMGWKKGGGGKKSRHRRRTRKKQFGRGWQKNNDGQFVIIQRPAGGWANIPAGRILIKYKSAAYPNPGPGQHNIDGIFQLVNGFFVKESTGRQIPEADVLMLTEWDDMPDLVDNEDGEVPEALYPLPFGGGRKTRKKRGSGGTHASGFCMGCGNNTQNNAQVEEQLFRKPEEQLFREPDPPRMSVDPLNVDRRTPPPDITSQYTRYIVHAIKRKNKGIDKVIEDQIRTKMKHKLEKLSTVEWQRLAGADQYTQHKLLNSIWNNQSGGRRTRRKTRSGGTSCPPQDQPWKKNWIAKRCPDGNDRCCPPNQICKNADTVTYCSNRRQPVLLQHLESQAMGAEDKVYVGGRRKKTRKHRGGGARYEERLLFTTMVGDEFSLALMHPPAGEGYERPRRTADGEGYGHPQNKNNNPFTGRLDNDSEIARWMSFEQILEVLSEYLKEKGYEIDRHTNIHLVFPNRLVIALGSTEWHQRDLFAGQFGDVLEEAWIDKRMLTSDPEDPAKRVESVMQFQPGRLIHIYLAHTPGEGAPSRSDRQLHLYEGGGGRRKTKRRKTRRRKTRSPQNQ
jgi:hypothetical protein